MRLSDYTKKQRLLIEAAAKLLHVRVAEVREVEFLGGARLRLVVGHQGRRIVEVPPHVLPPGFFSEPETGAVQPALEEPEVAMPEPVPLAFTDLLGSRLCGLLKRHDLLNPITLAGMTDEELREYPGIGPKTVPIIRQVLREYQQSRLPEL